MKLEHNPTKFSTPSNSIGRYDTGRFKRNLELSLYFASALPKAVSKIENGVTAFSLPFSHILKYKSSGIIRATTPTLGFITSFASFNASN